MLMSVNTFFAHARFPGDFADMLVEYHRQPRLLDPMVQWYWDNWDNEPVRRRPITFRHMCERLWRCMGPGNAADPRDVVKSPWSEPDPFWEG